VHPGTAHLARDAIGVFRAREGKYQDQVLLADHREFFRERIDQAQTYDEYIRMLDGSSGASPVSRGVGSIAPGTSQ